MFQIWKKKKVKRPKPVSLEAIVFKFAKPEEADISIGRYGTVQSGQINDDIGAYPSSHHFIKFDTPVILAELKIRTQPELRKIAIKAMIPCLSKQ